MVAGVYGQPARPSAIRCLVRRRKVWQPVGPDGLRTRHAVRRRPADDLRAARDDNDTVIAKGEHEMKSALLRASAGAVLALAGGAAYAQSPQATAVLIENVRIFNGTSDRLSAPSNVLIVGNAIKAISTAPIAAAGRYDRDAHRRRRAHADAGPDRRAHAHHVRHRAAGTGAHRRHRLRQRRRREGRQRHADARLHVDP